MSRRRAPRKVVGFELQLKTAMREVRKRGVHARFNVSGCCRSCISYDSEARLGVKDDDPIIWHYGGQGSHVYFDTDGIPFTEDRSWRPSSGDKFERLEIYFNHSNKGAERAYEIFKDAGLDVVWDFSEVQCMIVLGPTEEQVQFLRCQSEAYRMHQHWLADRERKRARAEALRREADELEASLA